MTALAKRQPPKLCRGKGLVIRLADGDGDAPCHGQSGTPTYAIYASIRSRCANRYNPGWKRNGALGIRLSDEWDGTMGFERFLRDMGPRPSLHHTLARHDDAGDFDVRNCFWKLCPRLQSRQPRSRNKTKMAQ